MQRLVSRGTQGVNLYERDTENENAQGPMKTPSKRVVPFGVRDMNEIVNNEANKIIDKPSKGSLDTEKEELEEELTELEFANSALEASVAMQADKIQTLDADNSQLSRKVSELEESNEGLTEQVETQNLKLQELEEVVESLKNNVEELTDANKEQDLIIKELQDELKNLTKSTQVEYEDDAGNKTEEYWGECVRLRDEIIAALQKKEELSAVVKPTVLEAGDKAWQTDSSKESCNHCSEPFNTFRRRHHCRMCGHLFCNTCCPKNNSVFSAGADQKRCCFPCMNRVDDAKKTLAQLTEKLNDQSSKLNEDGDGDDRETQGKQKTQEKQEEETALPTETQEVAVPDIEPDMPPTTAVDVLATVEESEEQETENSKQVPEHERADSEDLDINIDFEALDLSAI